MNSNDRIAATVYSLGTWFVSGIYVQIPGMKEITMKIIIIIMMSLYLIKYHALNIYGERRYYSKHSEPGNCKVIG
jgi:hypothetical protein